MSLKRSTETTSTDVMNQNNGRLMRLIDQAIKECLFDMNNTFKDEFAKRQIVIKLTLKADDASFMTVTDSVETKLASFNRVPEPEAPNGQMNMFSDLGEIDPDAEFEDDVLAIDYEGDSF